MTEAEIDTMKKAYLGDSVYVEFDGFYIVLTTENGLPGDPSNRICLEPEAIASLVAFEKRTREAAAT